MGSGGTGGGPGTGGGSYAGGEGWGPTMGGGSGYGGDLGGLGTAGTMSGGAGGAGMSGYGGGGQAGMAGSGWGGSGGTPGRNNSFGVSGGVKAVTNQTPGYKGPVVPGYHVVTTKTRYVPGEGQQYAHVLVKNSPVPANSFRSPVANAADMNLNYTDPGQVNRITGAINAPGYQSSSLYGSTARSAPSGDTSGLGRPGTNAVGGKNANQ